LLHLKLRSIAVFFFNKYRIRNSRKIIAFAVVFIFSSIHASAQIDTDVSEKTVALYNNLKMIQNSDQFLFGQEFFNSFRYSSGGAHGDETYSDSKEVTGAHPAVLGSDFHYYLTKSTDERSYHTEAVKWAYQKGYVITFDWHLSGRGTTTYEFGESTKDLVDSIVAYPGGSDRAWLYDELDKVITIINEDLVVNGERIPIVFRPWHEMNGNWFWWGSAATTPAIYKEFYRLTVNYIKQQTNSVLFCWSPNTPTNFNYYPGDDVVDVLGVDYYEINASNLRQQLAPIVDHAQANDKVAVFSETGNRTTSGDNAATYWNNTVLPAIVDDPSGKSLKIAWMLTWINASWSYAYVPHAGSSAVAKQSFKDFRNSSYALFGDEIQNMYTPWITVSVPEETLAGIDLFPVPAHTVLTIKSGGLALPLTITIFDLSGKEVFSLQSSSELTELNVQDKMSPGIYLVGIRDQKRTIRKTLVIN
jgi:mannan endo-1,4-beta-mannosidase